jgi:hypothetical protein
MKRTASIVLAVVLVLSCALPGQEPQKKPVPPAEDPAIAALVAAMQKAESAAKSVELELVTTGTYPGGLTFTTKGTMRVLLGEQRALHTTMEFQAAHGMTGRVETVRTPDGVWMLENSPTFGEVYLFMDPATLADVEWAAAVTQQPGAVPGGVDGRSIGPLGSQLLEDLRRHYDLAVLSKKDRDGQPGLWIGGDHKKSLDPGADTELLLADHVEVFVREVDQAVLAVVYMQADGKIVQQIEVRRIVTNQTMELASFHLDVPGKKPVDVKEHAPAWSPLQRLIGEAEDKAGADQRPSKKKSGEKKPEAKTPEDKKPEEKKADEKKTEAKK